MTQQKFLNGIHEKEAAQYLKDIGVFDKVIATSQFGGAGFEIIIAANVEYEKRNKSEKQK